MATESRKPGHPSISPIEITTSGDDPRELASSFSSIMAQITIPFLIAGCGTISAGIILSHVQNWKVYKDISEIFIIVPALCGLKGNLDMCVASRLCTHANLGQMSSCGAIRKIVIGNIALVQVQAITCSFSLSCLTLVVYFLSEGGRIAISNFLILLSAAMFTASTSCLILDTILMVVILFSLRYRINPDFMATPIVASIGDVVAISLVSFSAAYMNEINKNYATLVCVSIVFVYIILLPFWILIVCHNEFTYHVLLHGWLPVFGALTISEIGGVVLKSAVDQFEAFAVWSPIINGINGNLVSVYASFMGTVLHKGATVGKTPSYTRICMRPDKTWCYGSIYTDVARVLIIISIPGNIMIIFFADYVSQGKVTVTTIFVTSYIITSTTCLLILLWSAHVIVHTNWRLKIDPDSASIPYLTAMGDVFGTSLLAVMFHILRETKNEYTARSAY